MSNLVGYPLRRSFSEASGNTEFGRGGLSYCEKTQEAFSATPLAHRDFPAQEPNRSMASLDSTTNEYSLVEAGRREPLILGTSLPLTDILFPQASIPTRFASASSLRELSCGYFFYIYNWFDTITPVSVISLNFIFF